MATKKWLDLGQGIAAEFGKRRARRGAPTHPRPHRCAPHCRAAEGRSPRSSVTLCSLCAAWTAARPHAHLWAFHKFVEVSSRQWGR